MTTEETPPTRSLHRKLAQIMYEAERIPKNGTAPQVMGGYKFVQVGDAADFIRKALSEKVLTMMPTAVQVVGQVDRPTKSGGSMTTVDLLVDWTITDGESGESITIQSFGAGADGGDKYSGKAMTTAMKYALLTGFLLSTGEDSEGGDTSGQGPRQARAAQDRSGEPAPLPNTDRANETLSPLGRANRTGVIAKGTGRNSDLEWRETPDGYHIGFLLKVGDNKPKPQVVVTGALAVSLFAATSMGGAELLGQRIAVEGDAFEVRVQGRRAFYRIIADRLTTDEFVIPPLATREPTADEEAELDGLFAGLPRPTVVA